MAFLNKRVSMRLGSKPTSFLLSEECDQKLASLMKLYPERFVDKSQTIRACVFLTYRMLIKESRYANKIAAERAEAFKSFFD